nr:hypothetical protein [Tanacetum cinerariifolium]
MDHNIDFSGSDQIQNPQYPDVHENPLTNDEFEAFMKANDDKMNDMEIEFDHFQKQCEQMQDDLLNQMRNFMQNFQNGPPSEDKEHEATTDTELFSTKDIQPLPVQEPPQNSDMHQIIEGCCVEASEEQKQKTEDTILDLVKNFHHKQFLCIHDDVDNLIESALDSKLLSINSINSQRLDKKEQEVKNVKEKPAERRNHAEKSLQNFRVIHKSSISLKDTSQISSVHAVTPILSTKEHENSLSMGECEVTLGDKRECDELICENSSTINVCDNHSKILFESNDDDLSSDDESFENIEYVDASVPDPAIVSIEEENVVQREEEEVDLEDISQIQDVVLHNFLPEFETFCDHSEETRSGNTTHANYSLPEYDSFCFEIEPDQERLINLVKNDIPDNSSNDPFLEEVDLFLSDNSIPPGIENVADDPEGDIRFLEELLIDDSILSHESSDSNFKNNPSISRPPPEPPDDNFDLEPEVISAVMEDIDEPDEHFDLGGEIFVSTNNEDVDYFPFMFVIRIFLPYLILPDISPLFLSTESEDTIFDPGISDKMQWYLIGMELSCVFICLSKFY